MQLPPPAELNVQQITCLNIKQEMLYAQQILKLQVKYVGMQ